jgi:hypothetical protein
VDAGAGLAAGLRQSGVRRRQRSHIAGRGDMLVTFSRLQATVPANDKRLALACLKLGQHLEASSSADPSRVLALALRCLGILEASPKPPTPPLRPPPPHVM